jgi:hypothetical protein
MIRNLEACETIPESHYSVIFAAAYQISLAGI